MKKVKTAKPEFEKIKKQGKPIADLAELRLGIDEIDAQLVELLNSRAEISQKVGSLKSKSNAQIFQPLRERELIDKLINMSHGPLPNTSLKAIYREILSSSRDLQKPLKIGYLGPEGTFSHMALLEFMGSCSDCQGYEKIKDIFKAVYRGSCDLGLIPMENSHFGTVNESFDAFLDYDLEIVSEHKSRISLSLISMGTKLQDLKTVYSHSQPLGQSSRWLHKNLPQVKLISLESTAAAAHKVLNDPRSAAIAHESLGEILGLRVLARDIEDFSDNWTRFFLIKPKTKALDANSFISEERKDTDLVSGVTPLKENEANKTTLIFSVKNEPGSLARVLKIFSDREVNLSKLESRPMRQEAWKYVFFADLDCNLKAREYMDIVPLLEENCSLVRLLGTYFSPDN